MTKEEKIAELIYIRDNFNYTLAPREVFDDAIEALKQEYCEDCISRQAVINTIYQNCIYENEYNLTAKRIKDAVEQLQPVTPQQEPFINKPCVSEKVCEHDKNVILGKIRAEIEQKARPNELGGRGNGKSIRYGLCMALEIIDKYIESEVEE